MKNLTYGGLRGEEGGVPTQIPTADWFILKIAFTIASIKITVKISRLEELVCLFLWLNKVFFFCAVSTSSIYRMASTTLGASKPRWWCR